MKINVNEFAKEFKALCLVLTGFAVLVFLLEWEGVLIWLGFEDLVFELYDKYVP